jgi:hypothetical protein
MPVRSTLRELGNENVTPERREHLKPDRPGVNAQVDRETLDGRPLPASQRPIDYLHSPFWRPRR